MLPRLGRNSINNNQLKKTSDEFLAFLLVVPLCLPSFSLSWLVYEEGLINLHIRVGLARKHRRFNTVHFRLSHGQTK
ncbi:Uncharacterized protein TCM_008688 [Theobroma cacao]|uniref:Uncharacterized protein n=1 Tax=Theobroma cacao TaxID=3641 RepID=A0A061E493_THECC|nr:Uncharacterized protein TCM_008688 [Theobroma cacao]